jgi:hypothetical protein
VTDQTPKEALADALQPMLPEGWRVLMTERAADSTDGTELTLSQRTVRRARAAGTWEWEVDFQATITVAGTDMDRAETRLDDELLLLVKALDDASILWQSFEKGIYEGGRLGYQATITITAGRE